MVHLDSAINNGDFGLGANKIDHRLLSLYKKNQSPLFIQVGSYRDLSAQSLPSNSPSNLNFISSIENIFNYSENIKPSTPRDVVWLMSSGSKSEEVVFDDFIDLNAIIVSDMNASITRLSQEGKKQEMLSYHDGFEYKPYPYGGGFNKKVHIQNSATSLYWNIPSHGKVNGKGRTEPVAAGGIASRGFFLYKDSNITYEIPKQPEDLSRKPIFFGLFIDDRIKGTSRPQRLITFPDMSSISINTDNILFIRSAKGKLFTTRLPKNVNKWQHLGFSRKKIGQILDIYWNGNKLESIEFGVDDTSFNLMPGDLKIGKYSTGNNQDGFRGWIDEFRVFVRNPNSELACNYAKGTMVSVSSNAPFKIKKLANSLPSQSHNAVANQIKTQGHLLQSDRFACLTDYQIPYQKLKFNIPVGTTTIRDKILLSNKKLMYDKPRPDDTKNNFCLSCHRANTPFKPLDIEALRKKPSILSTSDSRIQPMQPPQRLFGNFPADFLGVGKPMRPLAPNKVMSTDFWLLR